MPQKNIAEIFVEMLIAAGVERIHGITGDSLASITESVRQNNQKISWIPYRHEETAAFAAGAEAHLTGKLAVCAGSCGPGNLHLINGLYDCQRSRVPVLAIASHIPGPEIGSSYFQETKPESIFKECSHYCELISQPEQMPRILEIAMRTAIAQRGVAVVILPGNLALHACPTQSVKLNLGQNNSIITPAPTELKKAAAILNQADKITILGGAGCQGAHAKLLAVAKKLKAPIVHAFRGKEFIEYANPYDVGMTGLLGFSSGYYAMQVSEVVLMLGTDFPYQNFYPTTAKIIQVDIRGQQIGRRVRVDLGLVGEVKATLQNLLPMLKTKQDSHHLDVAVRHYKKVRKELDDLAGGTPGKKLIHPQYLTRMVDELAAKDAIFTCDVGTPAIWAARYLHMNGKRRLIGSFVHGSMASALPQAIGAQLVYPERQIISLSGDGGLSMLLGDILTLKQLNLPIKIIVYNNSSLNFVELEMKVAGNMPFGTELKNPNFAHLAESIGLLGLRAELPEQVSLMIKQLLKHDGPGLLEVVVNRQELMMPPSITLAQAKGFGLFMLKAIINGRGDEVIDLAKTNLFR